MTNPVPAAAAACWCLLMAAGATWAVHAQDDDITIDRNRIWINARFAFNVGAEFETRTAPAAGLASLDGSVSGRSGAGSAGLAMDIGDSPSGVPPAEFTTDADGDLQAGFEIAYGRALGFFRLSETREAAWGVLASFGTLDINIDSEDRLTGPSVYGEADWTQDVRLDTLALGFKLGPFLEVPLAKRLSLNASAGLAAVDVLNEFDYRQTLTPVGGGESVQETRGEVKESDWLIGFFGQAAVAYALNYNLAVFAGAQYQYLGESSLAEGGNKATLDLGQVLEATVGLRASF